MAPKKPTTKKAAAPAAAKANTKAKVTKPAAPAKKTATKKAASPKLTAALEKAVAPKAPAKKAAAPKKAAKKETAKKAAAPKKETAKNAAAPKKETAKKAAAPKKETAKKPAAKKETVKKAAAPKKETAKKAAAPKKEEEAALAAPAASRKRKASSEPAKEQEVIKKPKIEKKGVVINAAPKDLLHVYVCGEGSAGELGLGTAKNAIDVKRPRLNANLAADKVGVVQIAAGGMHAMALTHDGKILTWGVNDSGALGRDTTWEGGFKDIEAAQDSDSEDEADDNGLNPHESIPGEVDFSETPLPEGTQFVEVAAGDSCSFALTDDGRVYGWGTFRSNEGPFGFDPDTATAFRPKLIPDLKKITSIKAGANHAYAMASNGAVFAWGSGQQHQLGRKVVERSKTQGLKPREFGLPKGPKNGIKAIETGAYHGFAISKNGNVYGWGLNNFGETGIPDNAGEDDAVITKPQVIEGLEGKTIVSLRGGGHHSIAATSEGECLVWGRIDGDQMGISAEDIEKMSEDVVVKGEDGKARIIAIPQKVTAIKGPVSHVAASSDHNIVITKAGKAYSWGFSANYQTGQGTDDDIPIPTMIDNTAVREKKLTGAETGGQYTIITAIAADVKMVNGA